MAYRSKKCNRIWLELKHRNVVKVLAFYAGIGIVLIELANNVAEPLNLPDWTPRLVILLVIIGIPVAAILSWIFDITPEGIQRVKPIDPSLVRNSIAVLPFQDMSPYKDQEYFCDGIAEEIINALTHISELKVIARTSSFAFKNQSADVQEIGSKLDVNYLLEGSVRKEDNKLRITTQLVNIRDKTPLFSERFDRHLRDIFDIQDEISRLIVNKLKISLLKEEENNLFKKSTVDSEIYNQYLLARYHAYRPTLEGLQKGLEIVEKVKKEADNYAPIHQLEGFIYQSLGGGHLTSFPPKTGTSKSIKANLKALEIDPDHSIAHAHLWFSYHLFYRNPDLGIPHIERAIELDPGSSEVQRVFALYLAAVSKLDLSLQHIKKAISLDPIAPYCYQNASALYGYQRNWDLCIEYGNKALEIEPEFQGAKWFLGIAYLHKGEIEQAIETWESAPYVYHFTDPLMGYCYAKLGYEDKLQKLITRWKKRKKEFLSSDLEMAYISLGRGNDEKAMKYLQSALDEDPPNTGLFAGLQYDPLWDHLKEDPEFKSIMSSIWK